MMLGFIRSKPTKTLDGLAETAEKRITDEDSAMRNADSGLLKSACAMRGERRIKSAASITPIATWKRIVRVIILRKSEKLLVSRHLAQYLVRAVLTPQSWKSIRVVAGINAIVYSP